MVYTNKSNLLLALFALVLAVVYAGTESMMINALKDKVAGLTNLDAATVPGALPLCKGRELHKKAKGGARLTEVDFLSAVKDSSTGSIRGDAELKGIFQIALKMMQTDSKPEGRADNTLGPHCFSYAALLATEEDVLGLVSGIVPADCASSPLPSAVRGELIGEWKELESSSGKVSKEDFVTFYSKRRFPRDPESTMLGGKYEEFLGALAKTDMTQQEFMYAALFAREFYFQGEDRVDVPVTCVQPLDNYLDSLGA